MPIFENGPVRIHYEEAGSGFPMLVIPGGGLNATVAMLGHAGSFNPLVEFSDTHRCIALDIRNANTGSSTGPLDVERPWDAVTDDQLALMDHLGIDKFVVTGFCIGGPLIWNLIRRAPYRVAAAVLAHPSGFRPEKPDLFYQNNINGWAPKFIESRSDVTQAMVEQYLTNMYRANPDFVFTVSRDFVRDCQTPVLIMPDDVAAHPFAAAMETARLAPNAQVSLYPWREPSGHMELALRHARTFLKANTPI
ncbi:MAG: alpha/beta fold hydrolase [Alphaproteobacteria bacterium]